MKPINRVAALFLALVAGAVLFAFCPTAAAYTDTEGSWAAPVIQKAAEYGLMEGYPDGRFGVGDTMTRSQFVTVLCRMFSWEPVSPQAPTFIDCLDGWYVPYVEAAAAHDAVDAGGAFRPGDFITREEMAVMLVRGLGYDRLAQGLSSTELPFPDVTEQRGYVAIAYDLGIITGAPRDGQLQFLPGFSATREEAAAMLVRCYERYTSRTDWLHGFYAISSYSQLSYADGMDAVSAGWARLEYAGGAPAINQSGTNGNDWAKPVGAELVTDHLAQCSVPCQLAVQGSSSAFSQIVAAGQAGEAVEALADAARPYAGLTIDFEGLGAGVREDFTAFMAALRSALPREQALYVCVQPDTWYRGYDYRALGELCDKVILMAHDYEWTYVPAEYVGTGNLYSPVTPFGEVYTALKHVTDRSTGVADRSKLALAISFNTAAFHVDPEGKLLDTTIYHPSTATIARRLLQEDAVRTWDETARNPLLRYIGDDGERYALWYEDAQSVEEKLRLARMFGVNGVSVWRLGIIPDHSEVPGYDVWSALKTHISSRNEL